MDDIGQIRNARRQLGMTQAELANRSGVSQSLIAKIESGALDPGFSKVRKILDTLEFMKIGKEKTAADIMNHKVICVPPSMDTHEVAKIMKKHSISQIPVMSGNLLGLATESLLIESLAEGRKNAKISELMQEAPPSIGLKTPLHAIVSLLKYYPLICVVQKGDLVGVITKSDILRMY